MPLRLKVACLAFWPLLLLLLGIQENHCLDVRFDDPTTGFFLRKTNAASSHAASSASVDISTLGVASPSPTTSIILGTSGSGVMGRNEQRKEKSKLDLEEEKSGSGGASVPSGGYGGWSRPASSVLGDILRTESFTVVQSSQPVTVRAEYGPFETSQMVPTQYLVPDLMLEQEETEAGAEPGKEKPEQLALITDFEPHQLDLSAHLVTNEVPKDNPVLRVLFHTANYHNIGHNAQICIVMTASMDTNSGNSRKKKDYKRPKPAFGSAKAKQSRMRMSVSQICDLRREAKDGTCLGQLTLPSSWWMPFTQQRLQKRPPPKSASASYSTVQPEAPADLGIMKQPKVFVDVKYSVFETRAGAPCDQQSQGHKAQSKEKRRGRGQQQQQKTAPKLPVTPETPIGVVTLTQPSQSYHQLAKDEMMHMLVPQASLYPNSKFYVPVFLEQPLTDTAPITAFTIKCRTRSGMRLLGVEEVSNAWKVRADINARGTIATVTAFKKTLQTTMAASQDNKKEADSFHGDFSAASASKAPSFGPQELFNWLLVIEDRDYDQWDQPRISWHVKYQRPLPTSSHDHQADQEAAEPTELDIEEDSLDDLHHMHNKHGGQQQGLQRNSYRLRAKMSVKKDEVQAVIPIAKHKELMNLAVLTGRQVSRPLKVFIVSEGGDVADVTLHSSCTSVDQSVLKVTTSCTSVYVDGSESRGALAAEIDIKYGAPQYMGRAVFTVWMPETPLNINVADTRLSQIKGWKVPQHHYFQQGEQGTPSSQQQDPSSHNRGKQNQTAAFHNEVPTANTREQCNLRYQQTTVRVFAKFLAQDPDSGRTEYFPSRSTESDVTDLVMGHGLRISNSGVATLRGNIIQGLSPGRTEIKVVSPITGQEIGMQEVRVAKNRETIRGMNVRILTGLGLDVQADPVQRGRYVLRTSYSQLLSSKYQEGLLDIELQMSDDTTLPLRDVDPEDYYLAIKSLDSRVIALAPSRDARFPRVVAVGNGRGQLLRTSLELIDDCMPTKSSNMALAVQLAHVNVQLKNRKRNKQEEMTTQAGSANDLWQMTEKSGNDMGSILSNIALRDDHSGYYTSLKGQTLTKAGGYNRQSSGYFMDGHLTPLEVGMYVLVAVLCAAMAVFISSCFVYASKFRRQKYPVHTTSLSGQPLQALQPHMTSIPLHPEHRDGPGKTSVQNAHDWIWLGNRSTLDPTSTSCSAADCGESVAASAAMTVSRSQLQPHRFSTSEVNVISNPLRSAPDDLHQAERIPLKQLHTSSRSSSAAYSATASHQPLTQSSSHFYHPQRHFASEQHLPASNAGPGEDRDTCTYENLPIRRSRRMQLPQIPTQKMQHSPVEVGDNSDHHQRSQHVQQQQHHQHHQQQRRRRLLPQINTATYTKKVADLNQRSSPMGILPVGYPVFLPCTNEEDSSLVEDQMSPVNMLPDPAAPDSGLQLHGLNNDEQNKVGAPLRQSPASSIPPVLPDLKEDTVSLREMDYEALNPDIDRPSPPRAGAARLFENPFDLTDEDSVPVEPKKLSPSHVFESTSLEDSLLLLEAEKVTDAVSPLSERAASSLTASSSLKRRPFDTRTFVIRRTSPASSIQYETTASKASTPTTSREEASADTAEVISVNGAESLPDDGLPMGAEAITEALLMEAAAPIEAAEIRATDEDDIGMEMDYDNLMAYFESLKESTA